jgi:phosphohistidine phosphatase SixA
MKLYFMRHGPAGPTVDDPKQERERPLLPRGKKLVQAVADAMVAAGEVPNVGFASPLMRASQTADILGATMLFQVNVIDDIAPNRPLEDRLLEMMMHGEVKKVLLVGHVDNSSPAFSNLGGDMGKCARDTDQGDGDWPDLVKGEVRRIRIDRKTGKWKCRWRLLPSDLGFPDETV